MIMTNKPKISVSVIMPALNEERNIYFSIKNTLAAFEALNIEGEIIIINDASSDNTEIIVNDLIKNDNRLRIFKHAAIQGIGASFWDGFARSRCDIVIMLPADNENDAREILRYCRLFDDVDIVIPFIYNKNVRPHLRNLISLIYKFIINRTFRTNFYYTNGTVLYRKAILKNLIHKSESFFFQAEILIRLIKKGYLFAQVPCKLNKRTDRKSRAIAFGSLLAVIKDYLLLVWDIYYFNPPKNELAEDSVSYQHINWIQ